MRNLYRSSIETAKDLAGKVFKAVPNSIKYGALCALGLIAADATAQPVNSHLGLDDLVNETEAATVADVDVDAAIPELTDLSQARWMRYDLSSEPGYGPGWKLWRVFMDRSPNDLQPDTDYAELRLVGNLTAAPGDSVKHDGYLTMVPLSNIMIPRGGVLTYNLPGTPPDIDNLLDYGSELDNLDYANRKYLSLDNVGTKKFFVNSDSTTTSEQSILLEEIAAYNDILFTEPTTNTELFTGTIPLEYESGNQKTWQVKVVDSLGGPGGTFDKATTTVYVARDGAGNWRDIVREEIGSAIMSGDEMPGDLEIYSIGMPELQMIDKLAARTRHFSNVEGIPGAGNDDKLWLQYQFAPSHDNNSAQAPENLPDYDPEAMGWLDSNGRFVDDTSLIGTDAPSLEGKLATLDQNTPNPFNARTTIAYDLEGQSPVKIDVYDIKGRHIKTLVDQVMPEGEYKTFWDGKDSSGKEISSGVYFYQLRTAFGEETKKMVLTK